MAKIEDGLKEISDSIGEQMSRYYDRQLMDVLYGSNLIYSEKFRNKKVLKYLYITIPTIEKHSCYDDDGYDYGHGWLITTKRIRLFPIGIKIIKEPVLRKFPKKGITIKFRRYDKLSANKQSRKKRKSLDQGKSKIS
ncbi:hypothetical protein M0R01_05015 [bacterium]|jgi:hypothetical protein|nr:hypothetical protein [bacterium]